MSIAYLDPGNIESDLQAGAVAEYRVRGGINIGVLSSPDAIVITGTLSVCSNIGIVV